MAFKYTSLPKEDNIRILCLESGPAAAQLKGKLEVWDGVEEYDALSWSWGDAKPRTSIDLYNSQSTTSNPLAIKPNLEDALRQLRRPDEVRRLWIDAVCKFFSH
jgi:Heterokaryon incompatibility protein (HET)